MLSVGMVGHRYLGQPETTSFVRHQCISILRQAQTAQKNVVGYSAIAEGADSLFAEAALKVGIPFEIVRPFEEYIHDFETPTARLHYNTLQAAAVREIRLSHKHRSNKAYLDAMIWILEHSDVLIAAWDGHANRGRGGTADAVKLAIRMGRFWIHVNVVDFTVTYYAKNAPTKQTKFWHIRKS